jgi:hypothetical protein
MKDQFDILKWRRKHLISEGMENINPEAGEAEVMIADFKSMPQFRSVKVYPNRGTSLSPKKLPYDIEAKFDFRWGDWEGVEEQQNAITKFFEEKGYTLVDEFEYDDDDRRASLTLYYKKK